jgi:hypothetical protein
LYCTCRFHEVFKAKLGHLEVNCTPKQWFSASSMANRARLKLASLARSAAKRSESTNSSAARFLCIRNTKRRILDSSDVASAFLRVLPFLCCWFLLILLICAVFSIFAVLLSACFTSPCRCSSVLLSFVLSRCFFVCSSAVL